MLRGIVLALLWQFSVSAHAYSAWQYSLASKESIDQEILAAEVVDSWHLFGGSVHIIWQRNDMDEVAKSLADRIKAMGLSAQDVFMNKSVSVQKEASLLSVSIEPYQQPYKCNYNKQNYSLGENDKFGCASANNLYMSLLNKNRVVF